jgi:hypothetical protein
VLLAADKREEAKECFRRVCDFYPGDSYAHSAAGFLDKLESQPKAGARNPMK